MSAAFGLTTWRWNNNIKSIFLLSAFPLLLLGILWSILFISGYVTMTPQGQINPDMLAVLGFNHNYEVAPKTPLALAAWGALAYWPIVYGVAAVWLLIGYFFNSSMIRAATGARAVERTEQPKLYNLLENLCISRGVPMPELYIVDSEVMNAFAMGIDKRSFSITVTRGLLDKLDDAELEAVLAHELTHIMNRDVRLLIITIVFTGMLSFIAQMLWRNLRYTSTRRSRDKGGNVMVLVIVAAIMLAIGYALALGLRFALSRRREFLADAGSVELTKNPDALIQALNKISGNSRIANVPPEVEQLFIDNPPSMFGLFDTHPPIEERINVLRAIGGLPPEGKSMIPETG